MPPCQPAIPVPGLDGRPQTGELLRLDRAHRHALHDQVDGGHDVGVGVDGGESSTRTSKPCSARKGRNRSVASTGVWPSQPPRTIRACRMRVSVVVCSLIRHILVVVGTEGVASP